MARRIDASLTATFVGRRASIPADAASQSLFVNMASTHAFQSEPHCATYAATKGGVVALTHALAVSA